METIDKKISRKASIREVDRIVVRFSGDSGDGMQLTGLQFTDTGRVSNGLQVLPGWKCNAGHHVYSSPSVMVLEIT